MSEKLSIIDKVFKNAKKAALLIVTIGASVALVAFALSGFKCEKGKIEKTEINIKDFRK